ncbi:phenylethanolamine N-methyltransferase-like [Haliotis rufescens]|uniref:phenylethanolamine N-methyltransferase-like n=1 Tax=Haliotis rufescens TaxID=6454 RepID=UPI00201FA26B|nr:phenylethanolamine N-methyltransferase-like [Haliotis rufescens]
MDDRHHTADYKQHFSPLLYLQSFYSGIEGNPMQDFLTTKMQFWHEVFVDGKIKGRRLLDIGTGPSVHSVISASPHCDEIYLTDFTPKNRAALKQWLQGDLQHSFESFFRFVVNSEGKGESWDERENQLRGKVSGILHIDLRQADPLAPNIMPTFDVITSSLCLEAAAEDITEYENMAGRVAALLKEDGHVILYGNIGEKLYTVGDHSFPLIRVKEDQVKSVWVKCGFSITEWKQKVYPEFPDTAVTGLKGSFMLVAKKLGKPEHT